MTLVGIGLLPEQSVLDALVRFSDEWRHEIDPPHLGHFTNIPHVSLHQLPVVDAQDFVDAVRGFQMPVLETVDLGKLVYQPVGWLFAPVSRTSSLLEIQHRVVHRVDPLLDRASMKATGELRGYSDDEKASYLRHGYRYVGAPFKPHFTLGRTNHDRLVLSRECLSYYDLHLAGRTVSFEHLVAYRAGEHGSLAEVLEFL